MTPRAKGILSITASAFGFALMAFFVRLCDDFGDGISCFQKSFFRNVIAFAIAFSVLAAERRHGRTTRFGGNRGKALLHLLLRSIFGTIGIFANFYALSRIPIGEAMMLNKTAPFFTVLFSWMFIGEKVSARQAAVLAVAFVGAAFVVKPGFGGGLPSLVALAGGLGAGAAYSSVHILGKMGFDSAKTVLFFSAFSCLASIPPAAASYVPMTAAQTAILALAGCGAAIGQFGVTAAYRYAEPRSIAVYDYTNVVFTSLFGFFFFDQIPDALSLVGFVVIFSAAVFAVRGNGRNMV